MSELPKELPRIPEGWTQKLVMHLNYGHNGAAATYDVFAPDGTKMPVQFAYRTGRDHKYIMRGYFLEGGDEPMTWDQLRAAWPAYVKLRGRAAAGGKDVRELRHDRPMAMVVIYDRPKDLPGGFVARLWSVTPGKVVPAKLLGQDLPTLEAAREIVPAGMTNVGRADDDDPTIAEVWV